MRSVLVIEDEPHLLDVVQEVLEIGGYNTISVTAPENIATTLEGATPDVFLIDIMLEGTSGIDIAVELRQHGYPDTPMIAMSASPIMTSFARQSGVFQDTIEKPFDIDLLLDTLDRYATAG